MNEKIPQKPDGGTIQNWVLGFILICLFLLVCRLFAPFFSIFLWSILLFIIVEPLHRKCVRNINTKTKKGQILRTVFAGLFALGIVLVVLVPLALVLSQLYVQLFEVINTIKAFAKKNISQSDGTLLTIICEKAADFLNKTTHGQIIIDAGDLHTNMLHTIESSAYSFITYTGAILRNIGTFITSIALVIFCLFFYFLDGMYLSQLIKSVIPIRQNYLTAIVNKFKEITRNLILGYLTVALFQATIAFIIFSAFKIQGALVFACLTFVCVFIPMVGGMLVWLPLAITFIAEGDVIKGIVFVVLCGVGISLLDNFLRPFFLQNRIQLHPLVIFFAILGGLILFQFNGLILGPMIVVLFLTVLEMFFKEHHIKNNENMVLER